jgi:hypothetical protein
MALSGDRKVPERKVGWFDSSVARCLKYFSPFGPESFDPELMTEGLTAEGLQSST